MSIGKDFSTHLINKLGSSQEISNLFKFNMNMNRSRPSLFLSSVGSPWFGIMPKFQSVDLWHGWLVLHRSLIYDKRHGAENGNNTWSSLCFVNWIMRHIATWFSSVNSLSLYVDRLCRNIAHADLDKETGGMTEPSIAI